MRRRILITKRTARRRASRQRPAQMAPPLPGEVATGDSSLFKTSQASVGARRPLHHDSTNCSRPVAHPMLADTRRLQHSHPGYRVSGDRNQVTAYRRHQPATQSGLHPADRPAGARRRHPRSRDNHPTVQGGGGPAPLTPAGAAPTHRRRRRREPNGGPTGWTYSKLRRHT